MEIKLISKPYPESNTTFIFNNQRFSKLRIPYQPILASTSQIVLQFNNSKVTSQLLTLLAGQTKTVDITIFHLVIQQAKQTFDAQLQVDYDDFAYKMIGQIKNAERKITVQVLDYLSIGGMTKVIDKARSYCSNNETQNLLNALAQVYIQRTKRSSYQKNSLNSRIFNTSFNYSQSNSISSSKSKSISQPSSDQISSSSNESQVQVAIQRKKYQKQKNHQTFKHNKKYQKPQTYQKSKKQQKIDSSYLFGGDNESQYRQKRNYSKKSAYDRGSWNKYDKNSSGKSTKRDLIFLGINGNTSQEWRQRFRPQHYKAQQYYRDPIITVLEPVNSNLTKTSSKVFDVPQSFQTKNKLYCYPHDEGTFKLKQQLLPFSVFLQPQNITIDFFNDHLVIKLEHGKTFKRQSKYAFIQNGIIGEGITLLLNGLSIIEDGGDVFVQSQNQNISVLNKWFFIEQATIFSIDK